MSRLIDADALLSKGPFVVRMNDWGEYFVTVDEINKMPTVDAVPVVRCKECKNLGNNDGYYFCNAIGLAFGNKPNWFCADGERKDGEHEER